MKFIYTAHAELRISQRGLSKKYIEEAIVHPDRKFPSFKGRFIVQKNIGSKILEIVYKKLNGEIVVITAYWLKEV